MIKDVIFDEGHNATYLSLLLKEYTGKIYQHTQAPTSCVYPSTAKSTAPAAQDNGKAAQTVQEAVGSNRDFVHPYHSPCAYYKTFQKQFTLVIPQPSTNN